MSEPAGIEQPPYDVPDEYNWTGVEDAKDDPIEAELQEIIEGEVVEKVETIWIDGKISDPGPPTVRCTCGDSFGPSAKLLELGGWMKNHAATHPNHIPRSHG